MRSAVFFPMPGTRTSDATSEAADDPHQIQRLNARQHRDGQLRSDATHADQLFEQRPFHDAAEPEQLDRILAHMRVNPQPNFPARLRKSRVS